MANRLLLLLLLLLDALFFMHVSAETVILGDSVNLTASEICTNGEMKLVDVANSKTVAKLVGDKWEPEENYKQRIEHLSTSAVRLNNVNINDRSFEFDCGGQLINSVQLTVVVPCELSVNEGEAASLMCHVPTAGVKRIIWEVNGTVLLQVNCSSKPRNVFKQFDGRVSVPSDRCTTGNMTLTVDQVRRDDHGVFVCYVEDEAGTKTRGNPDAVRMKVREKNPSAPPTTEKPVDTEPIGCCCIASIILDVVLLVVVVPIMCYVSRDVRELKKAIKEPRQRELKTLLPDANQGRNEVAQSD